VFTLNLREDDYVEAESDFPARLAKAFDRVLAETGGTLVYIPMLTARRREEALFAAFLTHLERREQARILPLQFADFAAVSATQAVADLAVGCTYHFLLFALAAGVPALGIYFSDYYRQKLTGLMAHYGVRAGTVAGRNTSASELARCIRAAWVDRQATRVVLERRRNDLQALHAATYTKVAAIVTATPSYWRNRMGQETQRQ
jgi:polysaccharide pyruvyl transferase WcaK-like protein